MPMTKRDKKTMASMKKTYGEKKGKKVFYASANKGTLGKGAKARHGTKKAKQRKKRSKK